MSIVANHLENEGKAPDLSAKQKKVFDLLNEVNTVSARIPGSQALKIFCFSEIHSYSGLFSIPILFLTVNPNPSMFQVIFGDQTINLDDRFPVLVPHTEHALRLAKDPVADADFFDFSIQCLFEFLFGQDFVKGRSSAEGGTLGWPEAFNGSVEYTGRGDHHGHFLLWLLGALNPADLHEKLKSSPGFDHKVFSFSEEIIKHHLPEIEVNIDKEFEPHLEHPLHAPPPPKSCEMFDIYEWKVDFETDVKKCGEKLQ